MVSIHSFYTNDRGSCEINFLVDNGENVVPLEVKAEVNLRAKSLKTYREKFLPELALRVSMADYRTEERLNVSLPYVKSLFPRSSKSSLHQSYHRYQSVSASPLCCLERRIKECVFPLPVNLTGRA